MKRAFKIIGVSFGVLILLLFAGIAYISIKGVPTYEPGIPAALSNLRAPRDSAHVARGAKISTLLCKACHIGPDGRLTGRLLTDLPKALGVVASLNITKDSVHGIGSWSDGELYYLLRTGLHKDGHWSPPFMPKFPLMADDDILAIIAWLRSDDPALDPDPREFPPNQYNFLVKFLANVAIKPTPLPDRPILIPDSTNQLEFGRYVADALCGCYGCHSADFTKQDDIHPEKSLGFYGGGNPMLNFEGETVHSANITMDKETGIGNWTREQFVQAVRLLKKPQGGLLHYPMMPHNTLTDGEVNAIWTYLQTVPTHHNKVDRYKAQE